MARKKSTESKKPKMLVRALRAEIGKPIGITWDELGRDLRRLRAVAHRAINAAVTACEVARVCNWDVATETVAYRAAQWELAGFYAWAETHKEQSVRTLAEIRPGGGVLSGWATHGYQAFKRWLKENRSTALPTAKQGAPIMLRKQEVEIRLAGGGVVLDLRIADGAHARHVVTVRPSKGSHWARLREIAEGKVVHGDVKIVYSNRERRKDGKTGKWYALISYSMPLPSKTPSESGGVLVVHRGHRKFLTLMSSMGSPVKYVDGYGMRHRWKQLEARGRDAREALRGIGDGARGHGRARRYRSYEVVSDKVERMKKTFCQQQAMRTISRARDLGCTVIVIEDYGGIEPHEERGVRRFLDRFPMSMMKQALKNACEREGIELVEVPAEYISSECPRCEAKNTAFHNVRTSVFHCGDCGFERPADWLAAYHMLQRYMGPRSNVPRDRLRKEFELARLLDTPTAAE
jgi:IS605 OrfB family transposase